MFQCKKRKRRRRLRLKILMVTTSRWPPYAVEPIRSGECKTIPAWMKRVPTSRWQNNR